MLLVNSKSPLIERGASTILGRREYIRESVKILQLDDELAVAKLIGNTPCVRLTNVSRYFGYEVYGKIETVNPTGSHKDRESLEVLRDALVKGYRDVGCASTGNAAISLAALSRMCGMRCHVYVSRMIWHEKLSLIRSFRPIIHIVAGDYGRAVRESNKEMGKLGIYIANPGVCHAKIIGDSQIGREISQAVKPDFVVCPTNNGTHIIGVWKGLREHGCRPEVIAATAKSTRIADSIRGFHKSEGSGLDQMIGASHTSFVDVADHEIRTALGLLLKDGVIAEPAGAAGIAALHHVKASERSIVCCTITGTGLKFPLILERLARSARSMKLTTGRQSV